MINFSWDAVRRIGGHVSSPHRNEKTLATLDVAVGGDWWQSYFTEGVTDEAVMAVVEGFETRLAEAAKVVVLSVPVRRDVTHKPLYSLIFATRNRRGAWHFGDATAKGLEEWRKAVDERSQRLDLSPTKADLERAALPDIEASIMQIANEIGEFVVGDYALAVFGDHYGEVGETVVRAAIKSLYDKGPTLYGLIEQLPEP